MSNIKKKKESKPVLYDYSDGIGEKIAKLLVKKNCSWQKLSEMAGMPSLFQMQKWYKDSRTFRELMDTADRVRARKHFEDIESTVDMTKELTSKEEIAADKLWFDKKRFLLEKSDPERFGQKQSSESGGTQINIMLPVDYSKKVDISDIVDVREITNIPEEVKKEDDL